MFLFAALVLYHIIFCLQQIVVLSATFFMYVSVLMFNGHQNNWMSSLSFSFINVLLYLFVFCLDFMQLKIWAYVMYY